MKLSEGLERVERVVDETVAEVLPDDVETTITRSGPGLCDSDDEGHVGYQREFSATGLDSDELFEKTQAYWKERGFETSTNINEVLPALFATDEGFTYSLQINARSKDGHIGGGTPCLEK